jgi:hypothetical protein
MQEEALKTFSFRCFFVSADAPRIAVRFCPLAWPRDPAGVPEFSL